MNFLLYNHKKKTLPKTRLRLLGPIEVHV